MNPLKQLAGQTAIYGLSSIVARVINFFFVPLYTRMLTTGNYGLASELLAYIALLQVVLTFGLETGFFRFASKEKSRAELIFSTALFSLGATSLSFLLLIILFAGQLSTFTSHPASYIIYSAGILAIDCFTAILFAELRFRNKAFRFALFRSIKIMIIITTFINVSIHKKQSSVLGQTISYCQKIGGYCTNSCTPSSTLR